MENLFDVLKAKVVGKNVKVVFPEADDVRILGAAIRLHKENIVSPVLIGDIEKIKKVAEGLNADISTMQIYEPAKYEGIQEMVDVFVEKRKGKATPEQAMKLVTTDVNYFGTMLVLMGLADCLVSGAVHFTADTIRPALQLIKTKPGVSSTSGAFLMLGQNGEKYVFADCAININPTAEQLAEIASESAFTAELFGIEPKVAMLSFSTMGSGKADESEKVVNATKIAKEKYPHLALEGEMQFDAAIDPGVGQKKAPGSKVAGYANVFVFPTIDAGNIGYKIAQRLGGYEAIGPILQGLNKPISDLSRGCNEEDVYKISIITALQVLLQK